METIVNVVRGLNEEVADKLKTAVEGEGVCCTCALGVCGVRGCDVCVVSMGVWRCVWCDVCVVSMGVWRRVWCEGVWCVCCENGSVEVCVV